MTDVIHLTKDDIMKAIMGYVIDMKGLPEYTRGDIVLSIDKKTGTTAEVTIRRVERP